MSFLHFIRFIQIAHPAFILRPTAQTVEVGADVSFECKAAGNPKPTMFFSIVGNRTLLFAGARAPNLEVSAGTPDGLIVLTIGAAQRTQNGLIVVCSALNVVGSVSQRSKLTITSAADRPPPVISAGPVNQTLPIKSVAVLNCHATGVPQPVISWYRDGIPVVTTSKINMTEAGELTILDLDKERDQGLYTCVASSRSGKATWSGFLRLETPTNPNVKFFRAPDAGKIPIAPSKPTVTNVTEDSITIAWQPTASDAGGSAGDVLGYTIEVFSSNTSKSWTEVAARVEGTSWTQRDLLRGATYTFFVRAENSHGVSAPSPLSDPTTTTDHGARLPAIAATATTAIAAAASAGFPEEDMTLTEAQAALTADDVTELLEANATDASSVRLSWQIINSRYVEGFYIYTLNLGNGTYRMLTVLHGGGATACTVAALAAYTEYEFFLVPFYKSVEGKPSNTRRARTLETGE